MFDFDFASYIHLNKFVLFLRIFLSFFHQNYELIPSFNLMWLTSIQPAKHSFKV